MASEALKKSLVVHPKTGELLDLKTVRTDTLLDARDILSDGERQVREIRRTIDDELVERADHEGRRSLTFDQYRLDVSPPTEKVWDLKKLQDALAELTVADLISGEKADRCIKWEPKPVWAELKTLLSDPRVRDQIEACFEEVEARRYVKVTRRG